MIGVEAKVYCGVQWVKSIDTAFFLPFIWVRIIQSIIMLR